MSYSDSQQRSIAEIVYQYDEEFRCESNLPVEINDPNYLWYIVEGSVHLFLAETQLEVEQALPQYLLSRNSGMIMPGVSPDPGNKADESMISLVGKGSPGTRLLRIPVSTIDQFDRHELTEQIDSWLLSITPALARFGGNRPRFDSQINAGIVETLEPGTISVRQGVVWVKSPPAGSSLIMDLVDQHDIASSSGIEESWIPITRNFWLTLMSEVELESVSTATLINQGSLLTHLATFHKVAFNLERLNRRFAVIDEANLERAKTASRKTAEEVARLRLFNIYDQAIDPETKVQNSSLGDALELISQLEGVEFNIPNRTENLDEPLSIMDVLDTSEVRGRRVTLDVEDKWWSSDSGTLLAFRSEDEQPVVLVPSQWGNYREIDPITKKTRRLHSRNIDTLSEHAWMFYPTTPIDSVKPKDLLRLALKGSKPDLLRLVLTGFTHGLISLIPAFAIGFVVSQVNTEWSTAVLSTLVITLLAFAILGGLFHLAQSSAMMRIEARSVSRLEASFWDRLIRLPPRVLRQQSSGDLAMSGMTFQNLRDGLQGVVADSFLSILFLLPIFIVIFSYDAYLGSTALFVSLISLSIAVFLGVRQINPQSLMISATRTVTGKLFQIIGGITKLRMEAAEGSAYDIWARDYRQQKQAELDLASIEGHSRAFGAALPFLTAGVLLLVIDTTTGKHIPLADFLVVFFVFLAFQSAVSKLCGSLGVVAATIPALRQLQPLLGETLEADAQGESVDYLGGGVLFDRISFRYEEEGRLILDDVTIEANPGEFIAIAGESGAGKSTIFRLALGLDTPNAGAVYYDGRDLRHLNLKQVRRQIGAVPQSVGLHPQDLWDNLMSHHDNVRTSEVWSAARAAKVEDAIKAMPMGMMTVVGTNGSVLSGGESQRVTIARSIISKPNVMLLDEATNWLDNENQAEVMQNLTSLTSTRIVIAHRLSTLQQADRIYVLKDGKVAEVGSFEDLLESDGIFTDLVKRQIV